MMDQWVCYRYQRLFFQCSRRSKGKKSNSLAVGVVDHPVHADLLTHVHG